MTATVMLWVVPPIEVSAATKNGLNTDVNSVSGSEFTQFDDLAKKLDSIFAGNVGLYSNISLTKSVTTKLGTKSVPPGTTLYWKCSTTTCSGQSCLAYAVSAYCTLYDGTHPGLTLSSNHKKIAAASGSTISYNNFVNWGVRDDLPVYVQIGSSSDGTGHSIIVLTYTKDYIIYLDGNGDNEGLIAIRKEPWKNKFDSYTGSNIYARKISYIVQPKDSYYPTHKCTQFEGLGVCKECGQAFNWEKTLDKTAAGTYTVVSNFTPRTNAPYNDATQASTSIKKGDTVDVIGAYENAYTKDNDDKWYKFTYNNGQSEGYVFHTYLTFSSHTHSFGSTYSSNASGHWKTCSTCDGKGTVSTHSYSNNCDTSCNTCGYKRSITHTYTDDSDATCNTCGYTRTVNHDYVHIKDDSYNTNFKAFPYAKITNDNLFDADHNKMNANNWIAATDECTILEVYTDGCCKVTYPLDSGGTRTLYSKISLFNIVYDEWKANDFNTYTFNTGEIKRFSYTPSDSGVHFLDAASFNYKNFKVCLYDKEGNELKSDMADYIYAEYDLTAGEKYIFTLQFEDTSISNSSIACHFGRIYKLSYHANGGSGAPATQQRKFNERETISNKKPTRDGYTFKGWSTNSSATTATYQPGDTFSTKADTTLYAVWAKGCENNAHNYDYDCDTTCNTCGHTRTITHSYDNDCDTDCNICGKTRDVKHVYDAYDYDFYNHWKVCSICGAIGGTPERHSVPSLHKLNDTRHFGNCTTCRLELVYDHTYTNDCDTSCNGCEHTRKIEHTYDNNCDTDCNVCGETRSTQHVYDDEEDTTCNICNDVRTVETLPTTTPEPETNPNTKPNVEPNTKPNTNNNNQSNSKDEDDDDDINQTTIIIIASAVTISAVSIFGTALVIKKKR